MLTYRQIELVQDSFANVLPITPRAAQLFYDRLFALAPDTRDLFRIDMAEQGRKLFLTLATVVDSIDRIDMVIPVAQALAIRHIAYGARVEHYPVVGAALLDMLSAAIGDRFNHETASAWASAYAILSDCMLTAVEAHGVDSAVPLPARA